MKTISLTQRKMALVDDADYDSLKKRKWHALMGSYTLYAAHTVGGRRNRKHEFMHRVILGLQRGDNRQCDHIDGDGLNNQRANLRVCTSTENRQSQRKRRISTSRYKGVYWNRRHRKWYSLIGVNTRHIYLGCFDSEIDAARAYDVAALKHFGQFALTNEMLGLLKEE